MPSQQQHLKTDLADTERRIRPDRQLLVWMLFAGWLLYSATALTWAMANDPLINQTICTTRSP